MENIFTLLIVDDNRPNITILQKIVSKNFPSTRCITAESGEEALENIRNEKIHLALLDVQMPGMNGFQLAEKIRSIPENRNTAIIFLTAYDPDKKMKHVGLESGGMDYLTKPVNVNILANYISLYLRFLAREQEVTSNLEIVNRKLNHLNRLNNSVLNSPQGVFIFTLDTNFKFQIFNRNFQNLMKLVNDTDVKVGQSFLSTVLETERRDRFRELLTLVLQNKSFSHTEHLTDAHGNEIILDSQIIPVTDSNGKVAGITVFSTDITRLKKQASIIEEKNAAHQRVNSDNLQKSKFLVKIGSEMNGILKQVSKQSQMLETMAEQNKLTKEKRKAITSSIQKDINGLMTIVDNLTLMSTIEAGLIEIKPEAVNFENVIKDIIFKMDFLASEKNITLRVDLPGRPPLIRCDRMWLTKVMLNLVSNGVKYTESGSVIVSMRAFSETEALISVKDSGPGIPPEDLPRIFGKYQLRDSTGKQYGSGLGLAISRILIQQMQGRLEVDTQPGQGSDFRIIFPLFRD